MKKYSAAYFTEIKLSIDSKKFEMKKKNSKK
jgi:hypothetical protein